LLYAESRAIARYISEKFEDQGTPLFGKTPKDRALVNQWCEVESQNFNPPVSSIVFQVVFASWKGLTTDDKVVEEQLAKLEKVLDVYEEHLSKNKYLAGDFFSMADLSHLSYTHYLVNVAKKGDGVTSRKHVNAWWEDISSRPAWKKVLELAAKK
jgi:glutathione S-transferase